MSSKGVRLGSARSELLSDIGASPIRSGCRLSGWFLMSARMNSSDEFIGRVQGLHGETGHAIFKHCEEIDGWHRQPHTFERENQGFRNSARDFACLQLS